MSKRDSRVSTTSLFSSIFSSSSFSTLFSLIFFSFRLLSSINSRRSECLAVIFFLVNYFYYLIGHRLMGPVLKWFTPNLYDTRSHLYRLRFNAPIYIYLKVLSSDYYSSHYGDDPFSLHLFFFFRKVAGLSVNLFSFLLFW